MVDPVGNFVIYIQRDEPMEVEYGGSRELEGLARVVNNARILRDFKNDDKTAIRVLEVGLGRFGAEAPPPPQTRHGTVRADRIVRCHERIRPWRTVPHRTAGDEAFRGRAHVGSERTARGDRSGRLAIRRKLT